MTLKTKIFKLTKSINLFSRYFPEHDSNLNKPLFDTRKSQEVTAAKTLLKYPFKYFLSDKNVDRMKTLFPDNNVLLELVDLLHSKHIEFQSVIDSADENPSSYKVFRNVIDDNLLNHINISSSLINTAPAQLKKIDNPAIYDEMNYNISENLNGHRIHKKTYESNPEIVSDILNCSWISEHIALVMLGIVNVKKNNHDEFEFYSKNKKQLRNVWFGSAFEKSSINAGIQSIHKLSELSFSPDLHNSVDKIEFQNLHMRVLSLIAQHWRLGGDGIIKDIFNEIADLIFFLVNVTNHCVIDKTYKPYKKSHVKKYVKSNPKRKGMLKTYDLVMQFQSSNLSEDRLFEISKGGLILGPTNQIRGLIQQAEFFAAKILGPNWHSTLEEQQKKYLFEHLKPHSHLQVLDFEFKPEHYGENNKSTERLDIDFFVRDTSTSSLYAVQLKHVTSIKPAGLSFWLTMLAEKNSKLNKGILQLENLKFILNKYPKAMDYLIAKGLSESDIKNLVPILVHNIGSLDFMQLQENIMVYDLHTFRKVLTGRSATEEVYNTHSYSFTETLDERGGSLSLIEPEKIIDEYLNDKRFKHFKIFDGPLHIKREVLINDLRVSAIGIGL